MTDRPGLVERTIGGAPVRVTIAGVEVVASDVGPVAIHRGRGRPNDRFDPAVATLAYRRAGLDDLPTIGQAVLVELTDEAVAYFGVAAAARVRFAGRITDAKARYESRVNGPALVTITAAGDKARLGQIQVGGAAWPEERDGARAGRILAQVAAAHPEITVGVVDPGQTFMVAKTADQVSDAEAALATLAVDSGGELVELRDGSLVWQDSDHRRGTTTALELYAENVDAGLELEQVLAGLVNDLTIAYGYEVEGVPRSTSRVANPLAFPATGGAIEARQESEILDQVGASARAVDVIGRRSRPRWRADGMTVDLVRTLKVDQAAALLAADVGFLVRTSGFPSTGPFTRATLWVEGWAETITRRAWSFDLSIAEYAEVAPSGRWADAPPWLRWSFVPLDISWLEAVGLSIDSGVSNRWVDQPSDVRWSTIDPALTWATA